MAAKTRAKLPDMSWSCHPQKWPMGQCSPLSSEVMIIIIVVGITINKWTRTIQYICKIANGYIRVDSRFVLTKT